MSETEIKSRSDSRTERPKRFKVVMLNDDFTPMDFVMSVLTSIFQMDMDKAAQVTMEIHQKGLAVVGAYTFEIAETKITQTMGLARQYELPLTCKLTAE